MDTDIFFLFPPFWLDVRNEQLWRGAQALALRPKTFAVLRYLIAQAGQLITQDELLDAVWGQTAVSEAVVRKSIRELRTILDDTAQYPQFIQPVCGLLRQGCGSTKADGAAVITAKVRRYLADTQLSSEDDAPLLLQLLDVPVDGERLARFSPQERKARTFALLRHLALHDSQRQPLVLAVENLHWVDATSEE